MIACRTYNAHSGWTPGDHYSPYNWQLNHADETARMHPEFYVWAISCGIARQRLI
jgi:hypothetical protein